MIGPLILLCLYVAVLVGVAWRAERHEGKARPAHRRAITYTLTLAALCSSWTYFGAAGAATQGDWAFIPNFLGPIIAITVFFPVWRRIAAAAKRENVGSIADFLSSRYGKSRTLGMLITAVAMIGALPYIALQLSSLSKAWAVVARSAEPPPFALPVIVAGLALLAILLGTRRPSITRHNRGLVRIVAIESTVKISALLSVAALSIFLLAEHAPDSLRNLPQEIGPPPAFNLSFLTATMLCMVTAITLPRQFHLGFVELEDQRDLSTARWLFPAYMALWSLAVVPIAVAGRYVMSGWGDPDTIVLGLPIVHGGPYLTAFVFLGGFSAAAAMVMIETVALSAMISNELVLPLLARIRRASSLASPGAARQILLIRRASILVILLLAWLYFTVINHGGGLAQLGFTSLAASAQLAPALVGAVVWGGGHARGATAGILGGMAVWLFWVVGPQVGVDSALEPGNSFPFEVGVLASLALNIALYVGVSLQTKPKLIDRIQSNIFVQQRELAPSVGMLGVEGSVGDLKHVVEQFLGREDAARAFQDLERVLGKLGDADIVNPAIARAAERMLAGAIGASSARTAIAFALAGGEREAADVRHMLDQAAQAVQFSRELLQRSLDSLDQGVCVVDSDIRLIAWNQRYLDLFAHDPQEIYVGKPLEELIRATAPRRGEDKAAVDRLVEERIGPIRRREHQMFERDWASGLTLRVAGAPLNSGEYVTSFTDVTELRKTARALAQSNEHLEGRVTERTQELTEAVAQLASAKVVAERATRAQERFVAAASHDLLQPLHAARLFLAAAAEDLPPNETLRELVAKADISIEAADRLMKALLNLSRLEMHGVRPAFAPVTVGPVLEALRREFEPLARNKGVRLHVLPSSAAVMSDPDLLRSVLQNLIGNAVRFTPSDGRIMVCCRRRAEAVRIEVRDSGPGIPDSALREIFKEFARLPGAADGGTGLGLAIADRICRALGHELGVWSKVGAGSVFSVSAPRCSPAPLSPATQRRNLGFPRKLKVLCIDDEPEILHGLEALLRRWELQVGVAASIEEASRLGSDWDVVLADYQLGPGANGLDFLVESKKSGATIALVTANASESILGQASKLGAEVIRKPVSPASLRAFLSRAAYAEPKESL